MRRLKALVDNLPPEAICFGRWAFSANELAASNVELLNAVLAASIAHIRLVVDEKSKRDIVVPGPLHITRPGESPQRGPERQRMTRDSIRAALLGGR